MERAQAPSVPLDRLVEDLQRLRNTAGDVSYAEIAARIARTREAHGTTPAAARVARSSVFDAFRPGRHRINAVLVEEIVRALGEDPVAAGLWRQRCLDAHLTGRRSAGSAIRHEADAATGLVAPQPPAAPVVPHAHDRRALTMALTIALVVGCVGVNLFGDGVVDKFQLPVWLDMIGTATAAIVVGPWHGALVGVLTNLLGGLQGNPETLPFLPVNVAGALVWGYGYRWFCRNRGPLRFLVLNVVVAISCTLVAVPINVLVYGGVAGHASDAVVGALVAIGHGLWVAVFSVNVMYSLLDKLIAGYVAVLLARFIVPLGLDCRVRRRPD
ncbi:ECF transporter S component [Cryobacterium melibiosiphilum]|uniref:ECF transporter S component n=1 Tax=Cryobacterium melibiosiphilum TaxID=995039 RepID=A0A3A5MQ21_9MICO|nr:ECF transporter S component [Cryobacterium melibiosiphilum]